MFFLSSEEFVKPEKGVSAGSQPRTFVTLDSRRNLRDGGVVLISVGPRRSTAEAEEADWITASGPEAQAVSLQGDIFHRGIRSASCRGHPFR